MAELFVFTLLAAIVATYGVLPRYRQLRIGYSLGDRRSIAILSFFGLIIIAGYLGGLILQNTEKESLGVLNTGFLVIEFNQLTVEIVQLGAALLIVGVFHAIYFRRSVRIRNEQVLLSSMRNLYNKAEYGTLVDLIRDNYFPLVNHPDEPTAPNNVSWMEVLSSLEEIDEVEENDDLSSSYSIIEHIEEKAPDSRVEILRQKAQAKWDWARYQFELFQYRIADTAENAAEYTETLLLDPKFSNEHPTLNPDLGIDVISDDSLRGFRRREFVHQYLTTLLRTENSLLYRDVAQNMHKKSIHRYRISPDNRLIYALLSDCERAKELDVYKPIGDTVKDILREQGKKDFDKYNTQRMTSSNLSDDYIFSDPIFVAITYFDIMVSEALHQRMRWHMWLYYYDTITRLICENYEITGESDPASEWPNDYSRFLYEMIRNMTNWLDAMASLATGDKEDLMIQVDKDPEHGNHDGERTEVGDSVEEEQKYQYADFIRLDSINNSRGANIPKSTVICLISCHKRILTTDEIPRQFKEYITDIIFRCGVELREYEDGSLPWQYTELMLHCIEEEINSRRNGHEYHRILQSVYDGEVRHEVVIKSLTGGDIVDRFDEIIL